MPSNHYLFQSIFFSFIVHLFVIIGTVFYPLLNSSRENPGKIYAVKLINLPTSYDLPSLPASPDVGKKISGREKISENITPVKTLFGSGTERVKVSPKSAIKSSPRTVAPPGKSSSGALAELDAPVVTPGQIIEDTGDNADFESEEIMNDLKNMEEKWTKIEKIAEEKQSRQTLLSQLEKFQSQNEPVRGEGGKQQETGPAPTMIPLAYQKEVSRLKDAVKLPKGVVTHNSKQQPATIFDYYQEIVRLKIYEHWELPLNELVQKDRKQVTIYFKIQKNGQLKDPVIEKSSGLKSFDTLALEAVKKADPFLALPEDISDNFLEVHFVFEYNNS